MQLVKSRGDVPMPVWTFDEALLRTPAKSVVNGLRAGEHDDPLYDLIKAEHDAYAAALTEAGVHVTILPPLPAYPDSVFVEDPAITLEAGAILLRPGAPSRRGESAVLLPELERRFDTVLHLPGTGFVEGGDVLVTPSKILIGLSDRTNLDGARDLKSCLERFGHKSVIVETPRDVLHFKSDCSLIAEETILTTKRLSQSGFFDEFKQLIIHDCEEGAANALRINDTIFVGSNYPRTIEMLDREGHLVEPLRTSEIFKLDAGLSCMSLRWRNSTKVGLRKSDLEQHFSVD